MNIIFLDIDGVLNSRRKLIEVYKKTHKPHSGYNYPFDEICLENLKTLDGFNTPVIMMTASSKDEVQNKPNPFRYRFFHFLYFLRHKYNRKGKFSQDNFESKRIR